MAKDAFGNQIDQEVDYARGEILKNSITERIKYQNAVNKILQRIKKYGENSVFLFTGNVRMNQLLETDLNLYSEEWVGPSLFSSELKKQVLSHLGGNNCHEIAIFNRTTAAIICAILSLIKPGEVLISFAPNNKPHPSINRGAKLAGVKFFGVETIEDLKSINNNSSGVCIITGITSELYFLDNDIFVEAIKVAKNKGMYTIVDDAYGARIRRIILKQPHALEVGANIVITNNDKAGLHGPRAGIMAGDRELLLKVVAKANEYGMEARAPIALAVLRSLERFQPKSLIEEVRVGNDLYEGLAKEMGEALVRKTILGPEVPENNLLRFMLKKRRLPATFHSIVPAEASAAVGFILLEKYGIITVNTCGMPGARASLRLKSDKKTVDRFGGIQKVINAVMDSIMSVVSIIDRQKSIRKLILGL